MAKKDSFVLYTEQKAVLDKLTDEQAGKLIKAIYEYVETGKMPELENVLDLVITPFKTVLDKDKAKYEEVSKARAEAGSKGGKQKQAKDSKVKQKKQLQIKDSNCDEYDNEYDNDLEKENIKKNYGENGNVKFTDAEYEKVKAYFPNDYKERIQSLDDYIQSKGKQYKDFFATLRTWARKEGYKPPTKEDPKEGYKEVDLSDLTDEEYDMFLRKKITLEELIEKGKVHV